MGSNLSYRLHFSKAENTVLKLVQNITLSTLVINERYCNIATAEITSISELRATELCWFSWLGQAVMGAQFQISLYQKWLFLQP